MWLPVDRATHRSSSPRHERPVAIKKSLISRICEKHLQAGYFIAGGLVLRFC